MKFSKNQKNLTRLRDLTLAEIVKFAFEMSKKILSAASILIRASFVLTFGIRMASEPSFGVEDEIIIGNVLPPSVDSKILTFAALTGAFVVFATFQVTVCVVFPDHETIVFGEVTTNGPLLPSTKTLVVAVLIPPALARLSRAIT